MEYENKQDLEHMGYKHMIDYQMAHYGTPEFAEIAGDVYRIQHQRVIGFRALLDAWAEVDPDVQKLLDHCIIYRMRLGPRDYVQTPQERAVDPRRKIQCSLAARGLKGVEQPLNSQTKHLESH